MQITECLDTPERARACVCVYETHENTTPHSRPSDHALWPEKTATPTSFKLTEPPDGKQLYTEPQNENSDKKHKHTESTVNKNKPIQDLVKQNKKKL